MGPKIAQVIYTTVATILVVAIAALTVWILTTAAVAYTQVSPQLQAGLVAGIVALAIPGLTYYFGKRKDVEARFFVEKRAAYLDFVSVYIDVIKDNKAGKASNTADLADRLMKFKQYVLVWGSPRLILALNTFEMKLAEKAIDNKSRLLVMDDILRELRKDLGQTNFLLPRGLLMALFLSPGDKSAAQGKA